MKPRTGFWIWAMMVFVLLVLQHTKLRPFPHILLLFWLLLPLGSLAHLLLARKSLIVRFNSTGEFERNARFPVRMQAENRSRFSVQSLWTKDGAQPVRLLVEPASSESVQFLADSPQTLTERETIASCGTRASWDVASLGARSATLPQTIAGATRWSPLRGPGYGG